MSCAAFSFSNIIKLTRKRGKTARLLVYTLGERVNKYTVGKRTAHGGRGDGVQTVRFRRDDFILFYIIFVVTVRR